MLAASDPQLFVPFGRQQIKKYCQNATSIQKPFKTSCYFKYEENEKWVIEENSNGIEEEVYWNGNTLVWSRGDFDASFSEDKPSSSRLLYRVYKTGLPIKQAIWCNFAETSPTKSLFKNDKIRSLCAMDSKHLYVFYPELEDHFSPHPFSVDSIWPSKFGLLLERSTSTSRGKTKNTLINNVLPTVFSLVHPENEITPLLMLRQGGLLSYVQEKFQKVVFTSEEPSICLLYDYRTLLHTVWIIRKATKAEINLMVPNKKISASNFLTLNKHPSNVTATASSASTSQKRSSVSFSNWKSSSPFGDSDLENISEMPLLSPLTTSQMNPISPFMPSFRMPSPNVSSSIQCSSPNVSNFRMPSSSFLNSSPAKYSKLNPTSRSPKSSPVCDVRLSSSPNVRNSYSTMPIYPELCLEYLWTENRRQCGERSANPATKAFISTDFSGQQFLCYVLSEISQLICVKLNYTNDKNRGIIMGNGTIISVKDASYLPGANVTVVIDKNLQVALYTGVTNIGFVMFGSIACSSHYFNSSLSFNIGKSTHLMRGMMCSTRHDDFFDVENISTPEIFRQPYVLTPTPPFSLTESTFEPSIVQSIYDSVGTRITLKYSDDSYCRVSFPVVSVSPLVTNVLKIFRNILPRDACLNLTVAWYVARNSPGTQDISSDQEWQQFLVVLLRCLGYDVNNVPILKQFSKSQSDSPFRAKKKKGSDLGSDADWQYLLNSRYHTTNFSEFSYLWNLRQTTLKIVDFEHSSDIDINPTAVLAPHFHLILFALHLYYEELRINVLSVDSSAMLAELLYQMAWDLNLSNYTFHYWKDHPHLFKYNKVPDVECKSDNLQQLRQNFPDYFTIDAPHIFKQIYFLLHKKRNVLPYPYINHVNESSHDIIQFISLHRSRSTNYQDTIKVIILPGVRHDPVSENIISEYFRQKRVYNNYERILTIMANRGFTPSRLQLYPAAIGWWAVNMIHMCRNNPPEDWTHTQYKLISREDLTRDSFLSLLSLRRIKPITLKKPSTWLDEKVLEVFDGMENMEDEVTDFLWRKDNRMKRVRRIFRTSTPVLVHVHQSPDGNPNEYVEEQERRLFSMSLRTMAKCVGRGMFTLHTLNPPITEPLQIPKLCLTGKSTAAGVVVDFSHIDVAANMNFWPLFHNGVAAGLRIKPTATFIDSTWILFNKPKGDLTNEHAGFLMALGLTGHLPMLNKVNMFDYMSHNHDLISIAIIIGLSSALRGTQDADLTRLLSLHVSALLAPNMLELEIEHHVQVAALLGIGLLYQGSCNLHFAGILLGEIGKPPGPEMDNSIDRESYALAAGFGLGLILLGKGSCTSSYVDQITCALRCLMLGGPKLSLHEFQREKLKPQNYQIREGEHVNLDITSPAATMALALIYFNTSNRTVADYMKPPETQYVLDAICPDFLLQRTLARKLIFWDEITPSVEYAEADIPDSIRPFCLVKPKLNSLPRPADLETINQAYCNIVSGACLALGLKYAGSNDNRAVQILLHFLKIFQNLLGKSISELVGKSTIESSTNVTLMALAMVIAGTGKLEAINMCAVLGQRLGMCAVTYGSHLATHMSLGLSVLGGGKYTLSTSPESVAAMLIAFYPKFPIHTNDNRYHLQAFRHLYVLAAEPRLLIPRDMDNGSLLYVQLKILHARNRNSMLEHDRNKFIIVKAPCLIPELKYIREIRVYDDRYWPVVFLRGKNWEKFEEIMKSSFLYVRQRIGCIPHHEDLKELTKPSEIPSFHYRFPLTSAAEVISENADSLSAMLITMKKLFGASIISHMNETERVLNKFFKIILEECIEKDTIYVLGYWLNILQVWRSICVCPNNYDMWQVKLFDVVMTASSLKKQSRIVSNMPKIPFNRTERRVVLKSALDEETNCIPKHVGNVLVNFINQLVEKYAQDHGISLHSCNDVNARENTFSVAHLKSAYLLFHDIEAPVDFKLIPSAAMLCDVVHKTDNLSFKAALSKMLCRLLKD